MADSFADLRKQMPPPAKPAYASGDWRAIESKLGTKLPNDYREFISEYGSGIVGSMPICVLNPFAPGGWNLCERGERILDAYKELHEGELELPFPLYPQCGGLLPWGDSGNAHGLNWRTVGDPDEWDVVVWDCGWTEFRLIEGCTMTMFLLDVVLGKYDRAGFPQLFFEQSPLFVQPEN